MYKLMTEAEVLRIHTDSFYRALKSQDFATLDTLYSEKYLLVRPDGSVLNKQQALQGLRFQSIDLREPEVRLFGSTPILTGESTTVSSRNDKETRSHFRFVAVYAQEDDAIRLVHFQSTGLPADG